MDAWKHVHVGTIGFSYPQWEGKFYPAGMARGDFLAAYARVFDTVELDTTFYGTPPRSRVEGWVKQVPEGFWFCPKTPRQITHEMPLSEAGGAMRAFVSSLEPMREAGKLGAVLIQFPPAVTQWSAAKVERFLAGLPRGVRYAVEVRNQSWVVPATAEMMRRCGVAWVAADYSRKNWPLEVTADFVYLRCVGSREDYELLGVEQTDPTLRLQNWVTELSQKAGGIEVMGLFADDFAGYGPATANRFRRLVGLGGLEAVPPPVPEQGSLF